MTRILTIVLLLLVVVLVATGLASLYLSESEPATPSAVGLGNLPAHALRPRSQVRQAPSPNAPARLQPTGREPDPGSLLGRDEGCPPDAVAAFLQYRDWVRATVTEALAMGDTAAVRAVLASDAELTDEKQPLPPPQATSLDRQESVRESLAPEDVRRFEAHWLEAPRRPPSSVVEFRALKRCAATDGEAARLRQVLIATLREEIQAPLRSLWFSFLRTYDPCADSVMAAILDAVAADLEADVRVNGWIDDRRSLLVAIAGCDSLSPADRERLFASFVQLIDLTKTPHLKLSLFTTLSVMFPFDQAMGRFVRDSLRDPELSFAAMELLDLYDLAPSELDVFFAADPGLLAELLGVAMGKQAAWALYRLLAVDGGAWGADVLIAEIENPDSTANKVSLIGFLGTSDGFPWVKLQGLVAHEDEAIRMAALGAIGSRAGSDDDAYAWLRGEAADFARPEVQTMALLALQLAGRSDVASFIADQGLLEQADPRVRAQAAATYAFQEGADLRRVRQLTDVSIEPDPVVRRTAALNYVMARRDTAEALALLEQLHADPDLGDEARIATAIYLESQGTAEARARAARLKPVAYRLQQWVGAIGLGEGIGDVVGTLVSQQRVARVADDVDISAIMMNQGSALARQAAGQAWLQSQLTEIATSWIALNGDPTTDP